MALTPRERCLRALTGSEPVDRVPMHLQGLSFPSEADVENLTDPLRRDAARRVNQHMTFNHGVPSYVNRYLVTPPQRIHSEKRQKDNGHHQIIQTLDTPLGDLTAVREYAPEAATTWQVKYPVECEKDIEKIASVPWERPQNMQYPDRNDVPEDFEQRGLYTTGVSSPMVCVAAMMSYEWFLELALTRREWMLELTDICRRRILDVLEGLFEKPGIEYVWMGGSEWLTPPMGSPELYDAFVQEQERSIIDYVHEHSNAVVHVHCHGNVRHALPRTIERHADYTEPVEPPPDGDITMAEAKKTAAERITLGGNVEARILHQGTEDEVSEAVHNAFEGGKERFILRTTEAPTPRMTRQEYRNYMRLIDDWEKLSPA